jgi:Lipocalin-like domain
MQIKIVSKHKLPNFKTILILAVFALLALSTDHSEAQQDIAKKLVGTWQVTEWQADMKELNPNLLAGAKQEALSSIYTLQSNNTFTMQSMSVNSPTKGTWKYQNKRLIMKGQGSDDVEEQQITFIDNTTMKWRQEMPPLGYMTSVLKRVK